jgi:hypothetical protein
MKKKQTISEFMMDIEVKIDQPNFKDCETNGHVGKVIDFEDGYSSVEGIDNFIYPPQTLIIVDGRFTCNGERLSDYLMGVTVKICRDDDDEDKEYDGHIGKIIEIDDSHFVIDGIDDYMFLPQECVILKDSPDETKLLKNLPGVLLEAAKEQTKNAGAATVSDVITEVINKHTGALGFLKNIPVVGDVQSLILTGSVFGLVYIAQDQITYAKALLNPLKHALNGKLYEFSKSVFSKLQPMVDEIYTNLKSQNLLEDK